MVEIFIVWVGLMACIFLFIAKRRLALWAGLLVSGISLIASPTAAICLAREFDCSRAEGLLILLA